MSSDESGGKSENGVTQNSEGLKRRDLLMRGTSLVAASAVLGAGLATSAKAQLPRQLLRRDSYQSGRRQADNSRISSSSWATISAGRTWALITRA